jgi:hypothetical protein
LNKRQREPLVGKRRYCGFGYDLFGRACVDAVHPMLVTDVQIQPDQLEDCV